MSTPAPTWIKGQALRRMKHARPTRGFTLVELMVAMALGLLLLGALISLIVSTVTGRTELDRSSRQISMHQRAPVGVESSVSSGRHRSATVAPWLAPGGHQESLTRGGYTEVREQTTVDSVHVVEPEVRSQQFTRS